MIHHDGLMPGMKVLDPADKIKTEIKPDIFPHIIMVSAFSSGNIKNKPGGQHIYQFLSKPVSTERLFSTLEIFTVKPVSSVALPR